MADTVHGQSPAYRRAAREFVDPTAIMRIKNLPLRAKVVVEGFFTGLHRSPYHGFSVEFSEYRQYTPGDEPRYLDWRLFARSDRFFIKRFEDETNRRCHLVVDLSRSMGYGSLEYSKADYARTLAATLAHYLTLQRDNVGLLTFDEALIDFLPARHRTGHRHRMMMLLERAVQGQGTDLLAPLEQVARVVHKRGLIVLMSDFLAPLDGLARHLSFLRTRGHEVMVLRVLDPSELDLHLDQPAVFRDLETGREIYVDPEQARKAYLDRFNTHATQLAETCAGLGIHYRLMRTDEPLDQALFELLAVQTHGRAGGRRARSNRGSRPGSSGGKP